MASASGQVALVRTFLFRVIITTYFIDSFFDLHQLQLFGVQLSWGWNLLQTTFALTSLKKPYTFQLLSGQIDKLL